MTRTILLPILLAALPCGALLHAQPLGHDWQQVSYDSVFTFKLPSGFLSADTLHVRTSSYAVDSLLAMQSHFFDSAYLNPADPLLAAALDKHPGDTLRAMAEIMLLATNSEITAIDSVNVGGVSGLEIGITYLGLASPKQTHSFIMFFLSGNRFSSFIVTGVDSDLERMMDYKDAFFDNVTLKAAP